MFLKSKEGNMRATLISTLNFVDPYTKTPLSRDGDGNLLSLEGDRRLQYTCHDGCYDFVTAHRSPNSASTAYDQFYGHGSTQALTLAAVAEQWADQTVPWRKTMLKNLGSLAGRRILLLGNGASYKEFQFLTLGASVVFTDLSLVAARRAQRAFRDSEFWSLYKERIEFHAVDAMHLPFADESFDVIYGTKFVSFLDNLGGFLADVKRCLRPGGICRFSDDACSPAMERIRALAHCVTRPSSRQAAGSLAALRAASGFGFEEATLRPFVADLGFKDLVFIRESFFLRVAQHFWGKIVAWDHRRLRYAKPLYLACKWIDTRFANTDWIRRNQLALTWGFDK
jgi:SAM-dependent methyltransferase